MGAVIQRQKVSFIIPLFHTVRILKILKNIWYISFPLSVAGEGPTGRSVEVILAVTLCILSVVLLVAAVYAFARWDLRILAIACLKTFKNGLKKSWNSPMNVISKYLDFWLGFFCFYVETKRETHKELSLVRVESP